MKAFYSEYIIDGIQQELTPARMLDCVNASDSSVNSHNEFCDSIVDESPDLPGVALLEFDAAGIDEYLEKILSLNWQDRVFQMPFAARLSKARIAWALIDTLWKKGNFRLGDLSMDMNWYWNPNRIGNMAAFYSSVQASAEYLDALGLSLSHYSYHDSDKSGIEITTGLFRCSHEDEDLLEKFPFHSGDPHMGEEKIFPNTLCPDLQSWIIYIPFDNCEFRLGGSSLARAMGAEGGTAPDVNDADYFIDCFEVVRELVEDGIILSGATVRDGGLLTALKQMTDTHLGADINIGDLMNAYSEKDMVRILFAEVPGVIIQIRDIDYDYVDAELLLQDVAYFPLGHPASGHSGVNVSASVKSGIQTILESIIQSQSSEGED